MGWESSGVVGFDLGPPFQGQTMIGELITRLLLVLQVWDGIHLLLEELSLGEVSDP